MYEKALKSEVLLAFEDFGYGKYKKNALSILPIFPLNAHLNGGGTME